MSELPSQPLSELTTFQQMIIDIQQGKVEEQTFITEFLNTKFHIAIEKKNVEGKSTFDYLVYQSQQSKDVYTAVLSEDENYIKNMGATEILLVKGGDIIKSLQPNLEVTIVFNGGGIGMPVERVNFLKQHIQIK